MARYLHRDATEAHYKFDACDWARLLTDTHDDVASAKITRGFLLAVAVIIMTI